MAFVYFARQRSRMSGSIEVGLGGRLDATNACRSLWYR